MSGAVKLKQRNVVQNATSTSRAEFLPTSDFDELNKLIDGENQNQFDIKFSGQKGLLNVT
jgi:hypothetical protein